MGVSVAKRPAAGVPTDATSPSLTIRETAALLALSTRTIHRSIAEGELRAYRVAGERTIRIKRQDGEALLEPVGAEAQTSGAGGNQP